jgi:hypothetical protein
VLADEQLSSEQVTGRKIPLSPFLCPKLLSKRRGGVGKGIGSKEFWADSWVARASSANRESTNEHRFAQSWWIPLSPFLCPNLLSKRREGVTRELGQRNSGPTHRWLALAGFSCCSALPSRLRPRPDVSSRLGRPRWSAEGGTREWGHGTKVVVDPIGLPPHPSPALIRAEREPSSTQSSITR